MRNGLDDKDPFCGQTVSSLFFLIWWIELQLGHECGFRRKNGKLSQRQKPISQVDVSFIFSKQWIKIRSCHESRFSQRKWKTVSITKIHLMGRQSRIFLQSSGSNVKQVTRANSIKVKEKRYQ